MNQYTAPFPVIGFAAYSGTGKTTLLTQLLPALSAQGLRIGMIKHSHHDFEIDKPGKDSYRLRAAGAQQILIASPHRTVWIGENTQPREPQLAALLARIMPDSVDLVLVEGFRHVEFPKIELHRTATGKPLLYPEDPSIIAIATDEPLDTTLPCLDINQPQTVAEFILETIATNRTGTQT
ncbi:molybdopterin guanine dinucleotide biosynthesis accessory protein MobB [Thiogranum longum]|uniref:Molybdopterin guanine dinucleotide biosynthesis accessory protein MobB n=1 Tax=Thiogranum longum TaxID=1537524 RepID=A0A4R1HAF1_9GAMM|nr:molybdopterin-guanine dinucleotide biosynthesis protein B [Thiogranum longum]TCK18914.1 molybdopterin guanine dinucleotide biosynthesis accessory protein MobB [Thiogranum longum]